MPELPEVETIRRGIAPYLEGKRILGAKVREHRLRWPVPKDLEIQVTGSRVQTVERRAKYLLLRTNRGILILHLGMSGSLRILPVTEPPQHHDHVDFLLEDNQCLRLRDPRRFGAVLWHQETTQLHVLLQNLGPEPLTTDFTGTTLKQAAIGRRIAIKSLIMDSKVVVGVGNIYASESLFIAKINPLLSCQYITATKYDDLALSIKQVLTKAIEQGGTTLKDFSQADGRPGYFVNSLQVYGREGQPCVHCATTIQAQRIGQRMSFFCPQCQQEKNNLL